MKDIADAKRICTPCPVFRTCLSTALGLIGENREEYGIWAGTSGRTRKRIWALIDDDGVDPQEIVDNICAGLGAQYERTPILAPITVFPVKPTTEVAA